MPPVFTTKKIGIQGEEKKVKYYRNKKGLLRARSECEMWAGKLVGLVSTIADIHTIIIQVLHPEPYKTNFSSFSFLLFFPSFLLKLRGAAISRRRSDGLKLGTRRAGSAGWGRGGDWCYRNGADVNVKVLIYLVGPDVRVHGTHMWRPDWRQAP